MNFKHRSDTLRALATAQDFSYTKKVTFRSLPIEVRKFRLFRNKNNRWVWNMLIRREPDLQGEGRMLDFVYWSDEKDRQHITALLFESPLLDLPAFWVRPKHAGDWLGQLFVVSETGYEGFPAFTKRFKVIGKDRRKIKYLLKPEILEFLAAHPRWTLEGRGNFLLFYEKNTFQEYAFLEFYEAGLMLTEQMLFSVSNDFV